MEVLVSIIMPAYNAERWIENAINRIQKQTYSRWELIVVDDGSVDKTASVCKSYITNDDRIKLFSQKNQGPSAARNLGLSKMKGDYFTIIDSDDLLSEDAIEKYVKAAEVFHADMVIAGYKMVNTMTKAERIFTCREEMQFEINTHINTRETEILLQDGLMASNWNKLYSSVLADLRFDETLSLNEDVLYSLTALLRSRKVVSIKDVLYTYKIQNTDSVSMKFHPELPQALEALDSQLTKNQNKSLRREISRWLMNYMFIYMRQICISEQLAGERISYLEKCIQSRVFKKYGTIFVADTLNRKLAILLLKLRQFNIYIKLMRKKERN